jgi:hypothetical protein
MSIKFQYRVWQKPFKDHLAAETRFGEGWVRSAQQLNALQAKLRSEHKFSNRPPVFLVAIYLAAFNSASGLGWC